MKIPKYRVGVSMSPSTDTLSVEVEFDQTAPDDVEAAFYLLCEDSIVERTRYARDLKHSFRISHGGTYSVKAFVRRGDQKASRLSGSVNALPDLRAVPELEYVPSAQPFADFALVGFGPGRTPSEHRQSLNMLAGELAEFEYDEWETSSGQFGVLHHQGSGFAEGGEWCFSGLARTDTKLIYGAADLVRAGTESVNESVGEFVLARRTEEGVELSTDYFGVARVYYYESPAISCASNSYHLLLTVLRRVGVHAGVDRVAVRAGLQEASQPFQQWFTRSMGVRGCRAMMPGNRMSIHGTQVRLSPSGIGDVLSQPNDLELDRDDYLAAVRQGAEEIIDNLRVALEHPMFDGLRVDVTGGLDSRTVLAAASHFPEYRDRLHLHTAITRSEPFELGVALELARISGFEWDTTPHEKTAVDRGQEHRRLLSEHLGSYFLLPARGVHNRLPRTLRLNGFFGESCIRPYFSRSLVGTRMDGLEVSEFASERVNFPQAVPMGTTDELVSLFRAEMCDLPGDSTHARYEAFYLFYRNAFHCSSRKTARTIGPSWGVLQSKKLFSLKWRTLSRRRDIGLQVDVIEALNHEMALVPSSDDRVNRERAEIYPRYQPFVGQAANHRVDVGDEKARAYVDASRIQKERSRWIEREPAPLSADSGGGYDRDVAEWLHSALRELVDTYEVVSQGEASNLLEYAGFGSTAATAGSAQVRARVVVNKVLSALYECRLAEPSRAS